MVDVVWAVHPEVSGRVAALGEHHPAHVPIAGEVITDDRVFSGFDEQRTAGELLHRPVEDGLALHDRAVF